MAREISIEEIEQQAQRALQDRMAAVRGLVEQRATVLAARDALRDAEEAVAKGYTDALASGWTDSDLRGFGLGDIAPAPGRARAKAPRARTPRNASATAE